MFLIFWSIKYCLAVFEMLQTPELSRLSVNTKRNLLYINVALFRILVLIEFGIILPTLWPYLSSQYGSSTVYFGLCLAGFQMSALPSSLVMGLLNDWKFSVKSIVLCGNIFQVSFDKT